MPGLEYTPAPMGRGVLQPSRKSLPTNTCFGEVYSDPLLRVSQKTRVWAVVYCTPTSRTNR